MANYVIGDIQGCYQQFQQLLQKIQFNAAIDRLWLVGDLVNRGPQSLDVLRFVTELAIPPAVVLGNHDLHLLAVYRGAQSLNPYDTFQDVLDAADCDQLCQWLLRQKLIYHDAGSAFTMVHAGIPPQWSLAAALHYAQEVETILQSDQQLELFRHMYGNQPALWDDNLRGWDRIRLIINYLTRMRFCYADGELDVSSKVAPDQAPPGTKPWFNIPNRKTKDNPIIFGHWAALDGKSNTPNVYALDTGCVWGGRLTAMCLEDKKFYSVPGRNYQGSF